MELLVEYSNFNLAELKEVSVADAGEEEWCIEVEHWQAVLTL